MGNVTVSILSLPCGNFRCLEGEELKNLDLDSLDADSEKCLILEVDLGYPEELHDLHNDYPLGPEKLLITDGMRSEYCSNTKNLHGNSSGKVRKLVTSLKDKKKYILHYRNLKLYLSLGLKLGKIHHALEFTQREWLKEYIDLNTEMRKDAKNSFEKDSFKLMNNCVRCKTMENLRMRSIVYRGRKIGEITCETNICFIENV